MVGYEMTNIHHEDSDRDCDLDLESCPASPGSEFSNRFNGPMGEMPVPAASSKCMGVVVVFNMTKRRVRHLYITTAGVSFLLLDSLGDALYAGESASAAVTPFILPTSSHVISYYTIFSHLMLYHLISYYIISSHLM